MPKWKKLFGPSTLVAAAFIGPGTLTTCTIVGVQSGYALLWVLLCAVVATIILQEMAARLGYATQEGLGEAFNRQFSAGLSRYLIFFLVISAILIGNAAYEAGNISGGILGLELLLGESKVWPFLLGGLCFALMYHGKYRWIERILIGMVLLMSVCFLITAVLVRPDLSAIFKGFIPSLGTGDYLLLILGLIGTTVVPYNLFLHASTVSKKWSSTDDLQDLRMENTVAIVLGGLISTLIVITAAGSSDAVEEVRSAKDLAVQLEPLFGTSATWFMGLGLMAAGISSALTAPLAAAYAAQGLFGWKEDSPKFRLVWAGIIWIGVLVAVTDIERVLIIQFAQVANALLLPFVAIYLLRVANVEKIMSKHTNGWLSNSLGSIVVLLTILLSIKSLNSILNFF